MQGPMGTRWECVAGGCQSTYLGISQSEQDRLVSGQNLTLCNTGSRSRPVRVSLPFLTKIQRLGNGMRGSRVIVRPYFKGHYNGIAYTCAASSRSSGSAKEDVREGTGAKQEIGGCINGETKTTKTKDAALPGLIPPPLTTVGKSTNIQWEGCMVQREERERMLDQKGCVIWITGLSGSGKSTLACALDHALLQRGKLSYVLDGDNVRHGLNNNLGFSAEDRAENIRRVGEVAKLFADTGVICIASFISPYRKDRDACREMMHSGDFIEVFMDVALEVCEQRDRKGLYKLARAGKIKGFTGIDDPYEDPPLPEIVMGAVDGVYASPEAMAAIILTYLGNNGFLKGP